MSLLPSLSPSSPIAQMDNVTGPELVAPVAPPVAGELPVELLEQATENRSAAARSTRPPEAEVEEMRCMRSSVGPTNPVPGPAVPGMYPPQRAQFVPGHTLCPALA